MDKLADLKIGIIGGGNMGIALADGLVKSNRFKAENITISRRQPKKIEYLTEEGFNITSDNKELVNNSQMIVLAILPQQFKKVMDEIRPVLNSDSHSLVSILSGIDLDTLYELSGNNCQVIRAMPNTAMSIGESMTCISARPGLEDEVEIVKQMFDTVGQTLEIPEDLMSSATALCACGTAFFLRTIRAASQGGVQIGFHADEAMRMATQTAKGAIELLLRSKDGHPEQEIDKVTSPEGCTIAGINELEHMGFSSAMIKGITKSWSKAQNLYDKEEGLTKG